MSQKPIVASGWSGQLDFLNTTDAILLPGELRNVEPGAVWENVIIPESQWFNIDPDKAASALMWIFKRYDQFLLPAKRLSSVNRNKFSYDSIRDRTKELLEKYVPASAIQVDLKLPTLKRVLPSIKKSESSNDEKVTNG